MNVLASATDISSEDVDLALAPLRSDEFRRRLMRDTPAAVSDARPWQTPAGESIDTYIRSKADAFRKEMDARTGNLLRGGTFDVRTSDAMISIFRAGFGEQVALAPRDLLHVYGPDRDNTGDWSRYYRYSWTDKGISGYPPEANVQTGRLDVEPYTYDGAAGSLAGVGMLFVPQLTDCLLNIRPYVKWESLVSLTHTQWPPDTSDKPFASAIGHLGIFVQSWARTGGSPYVDRDHWIDVWSYGGKNIYISQQWAADDATVSDGLGTEFLAGSHRKYAIYVYEWVEANAERLSERSSFATARMTSDVPYVVVEEKPM